MRNRKQLEMNSETPVAEENGKNRKKSRISLGVKIYTIFTAFTVFVAAFVSIYVYSWFMNKKGVGAYAPISAPDSLFIAAGHTDMEHYVFENIRYLYFHGIDASGEDDKDYIYLFCVYGKGITSYRIQLAYTTNNQFDYEIFRATEFETEPSTGEEGKDYIAYEMHTVANTTYYYTFSDLDGNDAPIPVAGTILNLKSGTGDDVLAKDHGDNDIYYKLTYGDANGNNAYANVNKYGAPLYWQTAQPIQTHESGENTLAPFAHYYILRIHTKGNRVNDRETDVICISATSRSGN